MVGVRNCVVVSDAGAGVGGGVGGGVFGGGGFVGGGEGAGGFVGLVRGAGGGVGGGVAGAGVGGGGVIGGAVVSSGVVNTVVVGGGDVVLGIASVCADLKPNNKNLPPPHPPPGISNVISKLDLCLNRNPTEAHNEFKPEHGCSPKTNGSVGLSHLCPYWVALNSYVPLAAPPRFFDTCKLLSAAI